MGGPVHAAVLDADLWGACPGVFRPLFAGGTALLGLAIPGLRLPRLAGMIWLGDTHKEAWIAAPFFGAIVVPFLVAFGTDYKKNWWALIPALAMSYVRVRDRLCGPGARRSHWGCLHVRVRHSVRGSLLFQPEELVGDHPRVRDGDDGGRDPAGPLSQ